MKTKLFTLLAALLCATAAWAQTSVSTDSELRAAIENDGANITVTADIDLSNSTLSIAAGTTVTINLNGHTLDRKLTKRGEGGGQVITVRSGATLNLSNGTLKGGWGGDSGGINNEGGTGNLTDVTITGCTGDDRGGGICNRSGGMLNMTGGSITGNISNDHTGPKGGGGLFNYEGATATLTGVTITGNTAKLTGGGGICNFGTLTIDGCTITGNTAGANGGAIWQEGTLNVQGAITVTDNTTAGGVTNNLFLKTGALITVTGSLTPLPQQGGAGGGSIIGINMESISGTFTSGYSTYNSGVAPASIFTSDLSLSTAVSLTSGGEAQLSNISDVNFIERSWDENNKQVVSTVKTLSRQIGYHDVPTSESDYKIISAGESPNWFQLGGYNKDIHEYYVVRGNVSNTTLNVMGNDVHIILCDGAKLTLSGGILTYITDNHDARLYIHSQSYGASMGKLRAESGYGDKAAGIGSDWDLDVSSYKRTPGDLEIHGGDIYAKGAKNGAGIGGGHEQHGGNVIIYGGKVEARGETNSFDAAGIGGGNHGGCGRVTIYDGTVFAYGGVDAAGIGTGSEIVTIPENTEPSGNLYTVETVGVVTIYGGYVEAHGGNNGAGIGGGSKSNGVFTTVNGGEVYAYGGDDAAGIGGGWIDNGTSLIVNGGKVYAKGGGNGAGIGSGSETANYDIHGGKVTVTGGEVYAYGGVDAAGIGGGEDADGGTIKISGGYVYAEGNDYGAGIGGGQDGNGGNITITGGIVIAKAGRSEDAGFAIGAGEDGEHGSLTLGDDRCVYITNNLWRCKKENRVSDCWGAAYVQISECLHGGATASVVNGDKHDLTNCKWCYVTGEDTHTFGEDSQCAACGLIRLADEGDNSALFSKWADGEAHDFLLSGRKFEADTVQSSMVNGQWQPRAYTVCLPFDMDLTGRDDLMVYTLSYIKDGSEMVFTQTAKKIEAGKPYLIVIHQGELELLGSGKLITTASDGVRVYDWENREQPLGWWRGTLTKIESADAAEMMAYALQSVGDFRRIRPDTPQAWWGAFRSMYCPDELPATNRFTINKGTFGGFGGETVTVTFEGDAEIPDGTGLKAIDNGQLTMDNCWYTLDGRRVANGQLKMDNGQLKPGIYINNGRKVVIK